MQDEPPGSLDERDVVPGAPGTGPAAAAHPLLWAVNLISDPIHGYIPFTSSVGLPEEEGAEQQVIDHPWLQRLRQIHQLQTAWWVFPTAEHTRFQHVLGAMQRGE